MNQLTIPNTLQITNYEFLQSQDIGLDYEVFLILTAQRKLSEIQGLPEKPLLIYGQTKKQTEKTQNSTTLGFETFAFSYEPTNPFEWHPIKSTLKVERGDQFTLEHALIGPRPIDPQKLITKYEQIPLAAQLEHIMEIASQRCV